MNTLTTENYPKKGTKIPEIGYDGIEKIIQDVRDYAGTFTYKNLTDGFDTLYDLGEMGDHEIITEYEIKASQDVSQAECIEVAWIEIKGFKLMKDEEEVHLSESDKRRMIDALEDAYPESEEYRMVPEMDEDGDMVWITQ